MSIMSRNANCAWCSGRGLVPGQTTTGRRTAVLCRCAKWTTNLPPPVHFSESDPIWRHAYDIPTDHEYRSRRPPGRSVEKLG